MLYIYNYMPFLLGDDFMLLGAWFKYKFSYIPFSSQVEVQICACSNPVTVVTVQLALFCLNQIHILVF
jgi:hypothetical protein